MIGVAPTMKYVIDDGLGGTVVVVVVVELVVVVVVDVVVPLGTVVVVVEGADGMTVMVTVAVEV